MIVLRVLGVLLLIAGAAVLGFDLLAPGGGGGAGGLTAAGELWFRLSPGSLNLSQAVIQRYVSPTLWDPVLLTVLLWPAAAVLGVLGALLLILGSLGRR